MADPTPPHTVIITFTAEGVPLLAEGGPPSPPPPRADAARLVRVLTTTSLEHLLTVASHADASLRGELERSARDDDDAAWGRLLAQHELDARDENRVYLYEVRRRLRTAAPVSTAERIAQLKELQFNEFRFAWLVLLLSAEGAMKLPLSDDELLAVCSTFSANQHSGAWEYYTRAVIVCLGSRPLDVWTDAAVAFIQRIVQHAPARSAGGATETHRQQLVASIVTLGSRNARVDDAGQSARMCVLLRRLFPDDEGARMAVLGSCLTNCDIIGDPVSFARRCFTDERMVARAERCILAQNEELHRRRARQAITDRCAVAGGTDEVAQHGEATCMVCMHNRACVVTVPCGHASTCCACQTSIFNTAATAAPNCIACRAAVTGTVYVRTPGQRADATVADKAK